MCAGFNLPSRGACRQACWRLLRRGLLSRPRRESAPTSGRRSSGTKRPACFPRRTGWMPAATQACRRCHRRCCGRPRVRWSGQTTGGHRPTRRGDCCRGSRRRRAVSHRGCRACFRAVTVMGRSESVHARTRHTTRKWRMPVKTRRKGKHTPNPRSLLPPPTPLVPSVDPSSLGCTGSSLPSGYRAVWLPSGCTMISAPLLPSAL